VRIDSFVPLVSIDRRVQDEVERTFIAWLNPRLNRMCSPGDYHAPPPYLAMGCGSAAEAAQLSPIEASLRATSADHRLGKTTCRGCGRRLRFVSGDDRCKQCFGRVAGAEDHAMWRAEIQRLRSLGLPHVHLRDPEKWREYQNQPSITLGPRWGYFAKEKKRGSQP
jgi:hypothetical protein